jgi:regulatory protein
MRGSGRNTGGEDGGDRAVTIALIDRWAQGYLARFASSTANLRRILTQRARRHSPAAAALSATLIEALLERYAVSGLLDDRAYAAARAESLYRRGEPLHRIRARLAAKGVAAPIAADALRRLRDDNGDPDLAAACAFARRRRLGPYRRHAADPVRELGAFARAGFDRRIARAVLACADVEAVEELARTGLS